MTKPDCGIYDQENNIVGKFIQLNGLMFSSGVEIQTQNSDLEWLLDEYREYVNDRERTS